MLYKIDYTQRNDRTEHTRFVNFAADKVEAVTRFMDWFHSAHHADAVRIDRLTEIEFIGDMSNMDFIDKAVKEGDH